MPPEAPGCPAGFPGSKWSGSCPTFLGWEWRRQAPASDDKVTASHRTSSRPAHRAPLLRCCCAVTKSCHQGSVIGDRGGRAGAEGAARVVAGRPVGAGSSRPVLCPLALTLLVSQGSGGSIPGLEGGHCGLWTLPCRNQIPISQHPPPRRPGLWGGEARETHKHTRAHRYKQVRQGRCSHVRATSPVTPTLQGRAPRLTGVERGGLPRSRAR